MLRHLHAHPLPLKKDVIVIFSSYEEVGHGASFIPEHVEEMISVDMGCIGLDLACTEYDVSICAKDSSGPYDYALTSTLIALAKQEQLPYAVDIYPMYSSDVSAALRGGNNIRGALIGPGVHASHGMERTHIDALMATLRWMPPYPSSSPTCAPCAPDPLSKRAKIDLIPVRRQKRSMAAHHVRPSFFMRASSSPDDRHDLPDERPQRNG